MLKDFLIVLPFCVGFVAFAYRYECQRLRFEALTRRIRVSMGERHV